MQRAQVVVMQDVEQDTESAAVRARLARHLPHAVIGPVDDDGVFELLIPAEDIEHAVSMAWCAVSAEGHQARFAVLDMY